MKTPILIAIAFAACTSEGYVSVRVTNAPASATPTSPATAELSRAIVARVEEASPTGPRQLLVTVSEVNVKVKPFKEKKKDKKDKKDKGCKVGDLDDDEDENEDEGDLVEADVEDDDDDEAEKDKGSKFPHGNWSQVFNGAEQVDLFDEASLGRFLGGATVPAGSLKEVRLVLDGAPVLVEGGVSIPVRCPSCSTSGFKIKTHGLAVPEGGSIELTISIDDVLTTDGTGYTLHPVLHLARAKCN